MLCYAMGYVVKDMLEKIVNIDAFIMALVLPLIYYINQSHSGYNKCRDQI